MFSGHTIIKRNDKQELILFLDFYYEFACFDKNNKQSIKKTIKQYIRDNNIKFNGKKILLVVGGVVLATLIISNNDITFSKFNHENIITYIEAKTIESIENFPIIKEEKNNKKEEISKESVTSNTADKKTNEIKDNKTNASNKTNSISIPKKDSSNKSNNISSSNKNNSNNKTDNIKEQIPLKKEEKVTIYRTNGKIETLTLEEYVIGVVAAEMPASFNIEAIKAQAILARTYTLKSKSTNKKLTDTVSTQAYIDISQMKSKWGSNYSKYYNKIKDAVTKTSGMYITYNGEIIDAVYHSTSNGYTEDSIEVWGYSIPYLKSVSSSLDRFVKGYEKTITKSSSYILKLFGIENLDEISIIKRNSSGRVSEVKIGNNIYSGVNIREMLSLRSTDFDFKIEDDNLIITTKGYGHGVGMSQYGANEMAKIGKTYEEIIKHYYQGVKIIKNK